MKGKHLVLIGLMGAGKTSVGRACATELGRGFVDTDELIVTQTGRTVADLFATVGEAGFRAAEQDAVADTVASPDPLVIACGGGAVLDPVNRRAVRTDGFVVWLQGEPAELAARVERDGVETRPLLQAGAVTTLTRLADARADAYAAAAHAVVATDGLDVAAVAAEVLRRFAEASP
ncbi:MAG: shikimate kinase [Acidimicrobiia bacterium]